MLPFFEVDLYKDGAGLKPAVLDGLRLAGRLGAKNAEGQSLFQTAPEAAVAGVDLDPAQPLYAYSLVAVRPPEPREFLPQDLITIIVRESSSVQRDQAVETKKENSLDAEIIQLQAIREYLLLHGAPTKETVSGSPIFDLTGEFKGEGDYERNDDVTARVTARVLEVKPNGLLLLEAKTTVQTDSEIQTISLSGYCRTEDVSESNTIQSSELYDLQLNVQHEGEIRKATEKGLIPRVFETIFNF